MTDDDFRQLAPAFARYLLPFRRYVGEIRCAYHVENYCRELLSDEPRKSVEPLSDASPDLGVVDVGLRIDAYGEAAKKNAEVTMEQVCFALNGTCSRILQRHRKTTTEVWRRRVIRYHQCRNAVARASRRKRRSSGP